MAFFTPLIPNRPKEHVWNSWKVRKFLTVHPAGCCKLWSDVATLWNWKKFCSFKGKKKSAFPPCTFCLIRKNSPVPWEERGQWAEDVLGRSWNWSAHTSTAHSQKEISCLWFSSFYFPSPALNFFFTFFPKVWSSAHCLAGITCYFHKVPWIIIL